VARALAVLLTIAGLSACGASPTSPKPPAGPLRLTVAQNPTFSADSLVFTMRLDNIGSTGVDLTFPSSCEMLPSFLDQAGRPVTPAGGDYACATVIVRTRLEPGAWIQRTIGVEAGAAPHGATTVLPAGSYRIYARLMDADFRIQSDPVAFSLR
jgi:hypothetical protein